MSHYLPIKIYFFIISAFVVLILLSGIFAFRGSPLLTWAYTRSAYAAVLYKIEFMGQEHSLLASALQTIESEEQYIATGSTTAAVPVLVYHGVLDQSDNSTINLTEEAFKDQMFALKHAGYNTISIKDLERYMKGEITLPPKSFLLTFDDGRKDSYYKADPVLKAVGYKATMFVISHFSIDSTNPSYYLSPHELKKMTESGRWELEAHTDNGHGSVPIDTTGNEENFYSHRKWLIEENRLETSEEYLARVSADLQAVKNKLQNGYNPKVIGFAFPFGDFSQEHTNVPNGKNILIDEASKYYPLLFYQHTANIRFNANYYDPLHKTDKSFLIKRIDIDPSWSGPDMIRAMNGLEPKALPFTDTFNSNRGWIASWGQAVISHDSLTVSPRVANAGAAVVLDGTRHWQDYVVSATVSVPQGQVAYLWVRFQDDNNNAACNFGNGYAHIEETVNGEERVMKGVRSETFQVPKGDFVITARVHGRTLECSLEGVTSVSSDFLNNKLTAGGIGFKTWDQGGAKGSLVIKDLKVAALDAKGNAGSLPFAIKNGD